MFGNARAPESPVQSEVKQDTPVSPLGEMAQAFFASRGGKVSAISNPRPTRPGTPERQRLAPTRPTAIQMQASPFAAVSDVAARRRQEAMVAEAEIVDDMFFESDAPGC